MQSDTFCHQGFILPLEGGRTPLQDALLQKNMPNFTETHLKSRPTNHLLPSAFSALVSQAQRFHMGGPPHGICKPYILVRKKKTLEGKRTARKRHKRMKMWRVNSVMPPSTKTFEKFLPSRASTFRVVFYGPKHKSCFQKHRIQILMYRPRAMLKAACWITGYLWANYYSWLSFIRLF